MYKEVLIYPDSRLKQVSKEVVEFDAKLHTLLDDMLETMRVKNGVGLAAIQIGIPLRALIILLPDERGEQKIENLIEIVNPVMLESEGSIKSNEGCLSVPGYYDDVERFQRVKISYQDRYGNQLQLDAEDFLAVAIQHEMDHLEGRLFIEKLSLLKRKKFEKEYKKLRKANIL